MDNHQKPVCFARRALSYLICALLAGQPVFPVFAATTPANNATQMDKAGNGVPVVNIATPNRAGISHNQYQDYNVGPEGLILNNATGQLNQTQLGGLIQNNPNLKAGQEARGIINEVTGANRSQLQGYTEVAGKAAKVMVANPYGITCNGCGFINTPNATLTTGKPVFDANGNLQSLDVTKGSITIEGQGLNASQSDAFSIISRATEINADIHARDLTVITGANRVTPDGHATAITGAGAAPVVAVDTGALGGMYANRIRLVSSDKGVGVNLGNLNARQGDITLDANGKLTVKNSLASGSLTAKGESVALSGEHKASGDIRVSGQDVALNSGTFVSDNNIVLSSDGKLSLSGATLTAGNNLSLNTHDFTQDGSSRADAARDITAEVAGSTDNQGQLVAGNNVALNGSALTNRGTITANGTAQLNASTLNNTGTVQSQKNMTISAGALTNGGQMLSGGELDLTTQTLEQNGTLSAKGRASINATNTLNNNASGKILSDDALTVIAGNIQQNGTLSGKNALTVKANSLTTASGSLSTSQGNIALNADDASLNGEIIAHGDLAVQAQRLTSQQNAQLQSDGQLTLNASDATLNGTQAARGNLAIRADNLAHGGKTNAAAINIHADNINNSGSLVAPELSFTSQTIINTGLLQGDRALNLSAQRLDNQLGGYLYSPQNLAFNIPTFTNAGTLRTDSALTLSGNQFNNSGALIASALTLQGLSLTNSGLLQGTQALDLAVDNLNNLAGGTIYSTQDFALTVPTLTNAGLITSDARLTLNGNQLTNSGEINAVNMTVGTARVTSHGRLLAQEHLQFKGSTLENGGQVAAKNLTIQSDELTNTGDLQGDAALDLTVKNVSNQGTILTAGDFTLDSDSFVNAGTLQATAIVLNLAKQLTNTRTGAFNAATTFTLTAQELTNTGMIAASDSNINLSKLTNSGTLQGLNLLTLTTRTLDNQHSGVLLSNGKLVLRTSGLTNAGLMQGKTLDLASGEWINTGNALSELDGTIRVTNDFKNQGKVLGKQGLTIDSGSLENSGMLVANVLAFRGDLMNSGLLQGNLDLSLKGETFTNQNNGQLLSGGTLAIDGQTVNNQGLMQGKNISLNAQDWQNGGVAQAQNKLDAITRHALINSGTLVSQQDASLTANSIVNSGKLAANNLSVKTQNLDNNGLLQGNSTLQLKTPILINRSNGQLVSGGALTLALQSLNNAGMLQVNDLLTLTGNELNNSGDIAAKNMNLALSGPFINQAGGRLLAQNDATLNGNLENAGLVAANDLLLHGDSLSNSGILQGNLLSLTLNDLTSTGSLIGVNGLTARVNGDMFNGGQIWSQQAVALSAGHFNNSGKVIGQSLDLNATSLANDGLWQGSDWLNANADDITTGANGRVLTDGMLTFNAQNLATDGLLQGGQNQFSANNWRNGGTVIATSGLTASVNDTLTNSGDILSKGQATIQAQTLNNNGSLLSEGDMELAGSTLNNSRAMQGKTVTAQQNKIANQGTLIGLNALTFSARTLELNNDANGQLLTQGVLNIHGGNITNGGTWQGQHILLNASNLNNNGAIQSADGLNLTLSGDLISGTGSKITANGNAALQALNLTNNGQWIAQNLTLRGTTLNNNGEISGVNGLTVALNGTFTQQQDKTLLTGGALALNATSVTNLGRIQGNNTHITSGTLDNQGRIQGNDALTLALTGNLTNRAAGTLLSQNELNVTTANLINYGIVQGAGSSRIDAARSAQNDGKLLFAGDLTFNTASLTNNDWLQATTLLLNAANATNSGTLLADQQMNLKGNSLSNQGTVQAANLISDYQVLTNSGTLLGNNQLNINASQVNLQAAGKLFSGGNLVLSSTGFDQLGQVVALGNLTVGLTNAFTTRNVMAAGNVLTLTSNGDITNQSVMQGKGLNIRAGGELTNNGQLTAGSAASNLSGSRISMNAAGTLQSGGDVALTSTSDIILNGFTGTRGSLTAQAAGSLLNTALLYAGNNMTLLANSIKNNRGDILAGNSLWMQRDTTGNANAEVVNTSGSIETVNGDIAIKTGHLLNEREGLQVSDNTVSKPTTISGLGDATISVPVSELPDGSYGYYSKVVQVETGNCAGGQNGGCNYHDETRYYYAPFAHSAQQKFIISQQQIGVSSTGGAARLAAGRDLTIEAGALENKASHILATRNIALSGNQLDNQSWENGTQTNYLTYQYVAGKSSPYATGPLDSLGTFSSDFKNSSIKFSLAGNTSEYEAGEAYGSVIQAGGNVTASFTHDISNTTTTANAGKISNTITAPTLNTLSNQNIDSGVQKKSLASADNLTPGTPQWQDQLQNAIQQINGGGNLDNSSADLSSRDFAAQGNAVLGSQGDLADPAMQNAALVKPGSSSLNNHAGKAVDTRAYPLPDSQNGYFVAATDPKSPYLIVTNPKLDGLGQLDPSLFGDLHAMTGMKPGEAPRETSSTYTDQNKFLGSSYFLDRLNLHPEYDYRFLGDAAFDTRYVSNFMLNQTGNRYINGIGSDLAQMQYLMDNAAFAQQSLGLAFGIALTQAQIASLDKSILWWEATTINGQMVMVPKVYLSPKDVTVSNGSVISGNNVQLAGGNITNSGSSITAKNNLSLDSGNSISNLSNGLINAGGNLELSSLGDINNIGSTISGKTVQLESLDGSINNITQTSTWGLDTGGKNGHVGIVDTTVGNIASITSLDALSLRAGQNINITGANVAAGGNVLMDAWGDIAITANQVTHRYSQSGFRGTEATSTESVTQQGSTISAGGNLDMQAGNDLTVEASAVNAGNNATLIAGNDLNLNAGQTSESSSKGSSETHSTDNDHTTITAGGDLGLAAGQDINSQAAGIAAEGNVAMQAGRDVNLLAAETTEGDSDKAKKKVEINESVRQDSTEIASSGNTTIVAGRDVNTEAAQVTASGDIGVAAGHDINLSTATESDYAYREETRTHHGLFSKTTTHTVKEDASTREAGTLLSGNNVTLNAGNNLKVEGSAVAGDGEVSLSARNNVDVVAATNTDSLYRLEEKHKSGLMGTGGIGITIGSNRSRHEVNDNGTTQSQSVSTVGSTGGNVSIIAGSQAHVGGADLVAKKDISVSGDSVLIEPGHDRRSRDEKLEQKQSGVTLALSGVAGEAINQAVSAAQAAKSQSDGRLAALQATKAVLSGVQANQGMQKEQVTGDPNNGIAISLSLSTQKSQSQSHQASDAVSGSTLTAGHHLSVTATGTGHQANSGDIGIAGSQLKAAGDTTLNAQRDLLLSSAANTQLTTGKNSSSGGAVGISFGVGQGSAGLSIFASGNAGKGSEKGNGTQWSETTVDNGGTVAMTSGRDTTLTGALVSGQKVTADVGRDLTLTSQQDSDRYNAKQQSVSGGASFTFGSMTASGGLSVSQDKTRSNYDSVVEQTGIYAGQGGFDIFTGHHTQLNGAVIASTATADKNHLDTGTLGFNDIHNQADYKTQHIGVSVGAGSGMTGGMAAMQAGQNLASNLLAGMNSSGHAEGTTQSAMTDGTITVRDNDNQQQDVAGLSRDTAHANDTISPIFDKEKEQKRLQTVQLISDIGGQITDIYRTQGDIDGLKAAKATSSVKDPGPDASVKERDDYLAALRKTPQYEAVVKQHGIGSDSQKAVQAITGVLTGLAGGNLQAAIAGGMNPYVAEQIKEYTGDNVAANTLAHAVWGGIAAEMAGNNAAAGAVGAASGELATRYIAAQFYGADTNEKRANLSEQDKQQLSLLSTLAAGLAGGIAGDSTSSASAGAQAGKNAVENNALSFGNGLESIGAANASWKQYAVDNNLTPEETQAGLDKIAKGDMPDSTNITKVIVDGYKDGVLIAGAAYLGPAASAGKVVGGVVIAETANGTYQWFDLSKPGNENKTWDYWGSASAGITGALAPGRDVWQNAGIAIGGTLFTDGPDKGALAGTGASWAFGTVAGLVAPPVLDPVLGPGSGFVSETIGSVGGEFIGNKVKDKINKKGSNNADK
ncbi:filamentous hemagglutinin N-terminal domain-containing protein [Enterobacteriaceae bacterium RIT711]|nr:filamentous hemagglutinin N-terminal domain-containing protein [Enterobacteriaceae bacterium RIT711]